MRKTLKFSITLVLAVAMILSAAIIVSAETASNSCGEALTWEYSAETQTLVISGSGAMTEYGHRANFPWHEYRANIKVIELPEGLENIPAQAFMSCTVLEEINIPDSVKTIGEYAFSSCSAVTAINFGSGVESVAANAFASGSTTAVVSAPSIEDWVEIDFAASSANPAARTRCLYVGGELVTDLVIPETVSSIGAYSFYSNGSLVSATLPASVTSIGAGAFTGCTNLVVTVYDGTFANSYVKENGIKHQVNRDDATDSGSAGTLIKWYYYEDTKTLVLEGTGSMTNYTASSGANGAPWASYRAEIENIVIGEGITTIGRRTVFNTPNVTSIAIPNSVTTIYNESFMSCTGLTDITFGTGVTKVYSTAFSNCRNIKKVYITDLAAWCNIEFDSSTATPVYASDSLYLNGCLIENVVIPDGVVAIKDYAFYSNSAIESVVLSDSVETIGEYVFLGAMNLKTFSAGKGLKSIGTSSFAGCSSLAIVNTTDLGAWASADFALYSNPTSKSHSMYVNGVLASQINIPEGTSKIGNNVFYAILCAKSITIPSTLTSYEATPFEFNTQAKTVYGTPGTIAEEIASTKKASTAVFVDVAEKPVIDVESIAIAPEMNLVEGDKAVLAATLAPDTAFENLAWESDNEAVATIANGVITAVSEGTAVITATASNGVEATCTVTVGAKVIPVIGLELNITKATLNAGETLELVANVKPANADNQEVTWESSNEFAATVVDGVVEAVAEGTAIITAISADGEYTATCTITVPEVVLPPVVEVTGIKLDVNAATLAPAETLVINATVEPADAADKTVVWESDNEDVATVVDGLVTAIADGEATITATAGNFSATCIITVETPNVAVEGIYLDVEELELVYGDEYDFVVTFDPENATDKTLYWESTNEDVATIDQDGHLVALEAGITIITVISEANGDAYAECVVTVTNGYPVENIALDKTTANLNIGDTTTLTVIFTPANATNKDVTWTSSSDAIATVEDGVVTAHASGVATITATSVDGEYTATCKVIVTTGNETPPIDW